MWLGWLAVPVAIVAAFYWGRWSKLREFLRLQDEGLLIVQHKTEAQARAEIERVMKGEADFDEEPQLDYASYPRRDSEDRRDDWAIRQRNALDTDRDPGGVE